MSRYPKNWKAIAHQIKEQADWKCFKCGMQCLKPEDDLSQWSKLERRRKTLQVHHWNYDPSDNHPQNLVALCTSCHLMFHCRGQSSISPGQLKLELTSD
ncbi:HNH endonuclease [Aphanothece hegewaldii CCALA 016]|uniref:HNH endonuclease n=1 Tax=Aphanothece hegewaldii CCALA 016 TaxID=2107694 RepID=A0A2T1LTL9_9CHRO|nr:HNH endonuclease [Aphanothece hegewaldii]PSF33917.1 HNH endonuclease [Aphanothece hegewaldii CCALA 016]